MIFQEFMNIIDISDPAKAGRVLGHSIAEGVAQNPKLYRLGDVDRLDLIRQAKNRVAPMVKLFATEIVGRLGLEDDDLDIYCTNAMQAFGAAMEGHSLSGAFH
jgi:hypothetical protein